MVQIGKTCKLEVVKQVSFGVYLNAHELGQNAAAKQSHPQRLPSRWSVDVFLYLDSEDIVIATTPSIGTGRRICLFKSRCNRSLWRLF